MRTIPPSVVLMEEIVVITKWRATPTTAMLANAWKTQVNFDLFKGTYDLDLVVVDCSIINYYSYTYCFSTTHRSGKKNPTNNDELPKCELQ